MLICGSCPFDAWIQHFLLLHSLSWSKPLSGSHIQSRTWFKLQYYHWESQCLLSLSKILLQEATKKIKNRQTYFDHRFVFGFRVCFLVRIGTIVFVFTLIWLTFHINILFLYLVDCLLFRLIRSYENIMAARRLNYLLVHWCFLNLNLSLLESFLVVVNLLVNIWVTSLLRVKLVVMLLRQFRLHYLGEFVVKVDFYLIVVILQEFFYPGIKIMFACWVEPVALCRWRFRNHRHARSWDFGTSVFVNYRLSMLCQFVGNVINIQRI